MLSIDHEVLCSTGKWKFPQELKIGDCVLCFDGVKTEFKAIRNINIVSGFKGPLIHLSDDYINILGLPDCKIACIENSKVVLRNLEWITKNNNIQLMYNINSNSIHQLDNTDDFTKLLMEGVKPVLNKLFKFNQPIYELFIIEDDVIKTKNSNVIYMQNGGGDVFNIDIKDGIVCTRRHGKISWMSNIV